VRAVIDYFFGDLRQAGRRGSHIIIKDERLKNIGPFGALGRFEIPVVGGQKVKGFYLQRLVNAIDALDASGEENSEDE